MKKVLCVCPGFPPSNYADAMRLRLALPYLSGFGWDPVVLCAEPASAGGPQDAMLEETIPKDIEIIRVKCIPEKITRIFGLGDLGLRCTAAMAKAARREFSRRRFDAAFFSSTVFLTWVLAPSWKNRGIPYVLDVQDLWYNDYPPEKHALGKTLKYRISQKLAQILEPQVLRGAAHIVSVSPGYNRTLGARYGMPSDRFTALPFGAAQADLDLLCKRPVKQRFFKKEDGLEHWVYAGRGGNDMRLSARALFTAIRSGRDTDPRRFNKLRVHFIGTDYAPPALAKPTFLPLAAEAGIADLVTEHPARVPYFEALQALLDADALIMPGSDDPNYSASKVYPYILARKPLLAIFHEKSPVVGMLRTTQAGTVVTFSDGDDPASVGDRIKQNWTSNSVLTVPQTNWNAFSPYTAREMTRILAGVLDRVCPGQEKNCGP